MRKKIKAYLKNHQQSLKDLIDLGAWQKIQDNFSIVTDVSIRTVDAQGRSVTQPSREPRLCSELLKDTLQKEKICGLCLPTFLGGKGVVDRNLSFSCHSELYSFIAPLKFNGTVFGYVILGPVILVMRKLKEEYKKSAEEFNLDLEEFWSALSEIKVVSFQGMRSLVELIKDIGDYTIRLAYQNIMTRKEMMMGSASLKLSRLLNTLLEVAFQVTGADIGSVMFFDKDKDELTIKASRGIPDEVVKNTRIRLGEGIAGMAAKERRSFLIDDEVKDNRIRPYLRRPYLGSSMVLPISVEDRTMGVVNLGALKTSSVRFNNENLQLMNKLIDLASVAMTPTE